MFHCNRTHTVCCVSFLCQNNSFTQFHPICMCNISGSVSLESHYDIYSQTPVQLKLGRSLTEWKQLNDVILCLTNSFLVSKPWWMITCHVTCYMKSSCDPRRESSHKNPCRIILVNREINKEQQWICSDGLGTGKILNILHTDLFFT